MLGACAVITSRRKPPREILIAIPGLPTDLYRMHQCVWEHAERAATAGHRPQFLYRVENGLVQVRGLDFCKGTVREFRPGRTCRLDIAAIKRSSNGGEMPVEASQLEDWTVGLLAKAGFKVRDLDVENYVLQRGIKHDRNTGRRHLIELPVARLQLELDVLDPDRAQLAWCGGIGRGKRFGLGMLCH